MAEKIDALVVDDENLNLKILTAVLGKAGFSYKLAMDGKEAIDLCDDFVFGAVFMDLRMPRMDGYQAIKILNLIRPDLPIMVITAEPLKTAKEKLYEAKYDAIVQKPFNKTELLNWLRNT